MSRKPAIMQSPVTVAAGGAVSAYLDLRVSGTGDPHVRLTNTGGTSWYVGSDVSASDTLLIGTGAAVGTTPKVSVTTAGLVGLATAAPVAGLEVVTPTDTSDGRPASFNSSYVTVGTGGATGGCVSISYRLSTTTGYIGCIKSGTGNQTLHVQNTGASAGTLILGGSGATIGIFGAAGTTKPTVTGSKGANAALASLMTALSGLGLVTDSTS